MPKSTITYWNPLNSENRGKWRPLEGLEQIAEELTLSIDEDTGEYTRLTRFYPGADTTSFGAKSHPYPEEILVVSGRLYDRAFDLWLDSGYYAIDTPRDKSAWILVVTTRQVTFGGGNLRGLRDRWLKPCRFVSFLSHRHLTRLLPPPVRHGCRRQI